MRSSTPTVKRMARPRNKKYRPKPIAIPVMKPLHDEMAMHLRAALVTLNYAPSNDAFDMLAGVLNVVQVAIQNDVRFLHEAKLINGGAATMNQISKKVDRGLALQEHELASIKVSVNVIDEILPRLDVSKLNAARIWVNRISGSQLA